MEATLAARQHGREVAKAPRFGSAAEAREVLEGMLREVERDERASGLLRAAGTRVRIALDDLSLVVNVAPAGEGGRTLAWRFDDRVGWEPRLRLAMDSETANSYFQGRESLAIAIARGRVKLEGDARSALLYVPALRLLFEPYRRVLAERFPALLAS
jgi:hypothetical protein